MSSLAQPHGQIESRAWPTSGSTVFVLAIGAAFGVYWLSSFILAASGVTATTRFGSDSFFYTGLAQGEIVARSARFHPVTVVLAVAWMKILSPLTAWITPQHLFKAMFSAIGALGVGAAMWAFAAVVPRRHVLVCGLIYASSLGIWYFSSIEESKIVTASLSALYIAIYLQLRDNWSRRGAAFLTATLLVACLNEIVAAFLVAIPFVDTLVRRGWDWRQGLRKDWWIAVHGLTAPIAFVFLEFVVNGGLVARETNAESASQFSHLMYYLANEDYSPASLYSFVVRWLFFNIAAPTPTATHNSAPNIQYGGDFAPALTDYFTSPWSAALVVVTCVMIAAIVLRRYRADSLGNLAGLPSALIAYALVRGAFFMMYLPGEPLINSPAVVLAHLLIVIIPFTASRFPAKQAVLVAFATLLFITNAVFFVSQ